MKLECERATEEIEKALSSIGKLRILKLLMKSPTHAFTRYEIRKKTALSPLDIKSDLKVLVEIRWIKEFKFQHIQKYCINFDNKLVKEFSEFFKRIWYL